MTNQRLSVFGGSGTTRALRQPKIVPYTMKKVKPIVETEEPIGIIISRGDRAEARPVFSAYIWGPAPEQVPEPATKVA